jgi:hypothetical protein
MNDDKVYKKAYKEAYKRTKDSNEFVRQRTKRTKTLWVCTFVRSNLNKGYLYIKEMI